MTTDDDWRLTNQGNYLTGRTLVWRTWTEDRPGWDHDHCAFCWTKFGAIVVDDATLQEGYVTKDDEYHWVCSRCCADFQDRFGWTVQGGPIGA
jgi:hypothetical protein